MAHHETWIVNKVMNKEIRLLEVKYYVLEGGDVIRDDSGCEPIIIPANEGVYVRSSKLEKKGKLSGLIRAYQILIKYYEVLSDEPDTNLIIKSEHLKKNERIVIQENEHGVISIDLYPASDFNIWKLRIFRFLRKRIMVEGLE